MQDHDRRRLGERLLAEGRAEIARLKVLKGSTPKRRARRFGRANALMALAAGLLAMPVGGTANAATTPQFKSPFPFGLQGALAGDATAPDLADIDGDGDLDTFLGNKDGDTMFLENLGTGPVMDFDEASSNPFGLSDVGTYATPYFADLDGDGDLDALIGDDTGGLSFFDNSGSATAPAFAASTLEPFGLIDVGAFSSPALADMDGDGDLDALIGESLGNTIFLRNSGSATQPAFGASSSNAFGLGDVGDLAAPDLADIDGDGDLDALIGARLGGTFFFDNTSTGSVPAFAASEPNAFGLTYDDNNSSPALADTDGDGDVDVFIGSYFGDTVAFLNTASGGTPAFVETPANPFGLGRVSYNSSPALIDINGDGDLDAFVGASDGRTFFFENTGTSSAAFGAGSAVLADVGSKSSPELADIDDDGDLDALVGAQDGDMDYFENTGSSTGPVFTQVSTNPFGLSNVGFYATPALADIDGDGDLDAFVGRNLGETFFFRNTGSATAPAFVLSSSSSPFGLVDVGYFASPHFADVDGDGDLDALVGERYGNTIFFANTGSSSSPAFAPASTNPFRLPSVGELSSPAMADIDGDGDLDLLVGSASGRSFFFENIPNFHPTDISLSKSSVLENKPAGTTVGTLSAADADAGDSHTFALASGAGSADNAAFVINGNRLKTAASFDFEADATKNIRVRATDSVGDFIEEQFTIQITNVAAKLSINDVSRTEGDTGTKAFTFTVTRTGDLSGPVGADVATRNDTARAGSDFVALDTTVNFGNGVASKKIRVTVNGDTKVEPDERAFVQLSSPVNARFIDRSGDLDIRNDD